MEEHLAYTPYDRQGNYRCSKKSKAVKCKLGNMGVTVVHDRKSSFIPQVVLKESSLLTNLAGRVLSFYANWISTRDISTQMEEIYGVAFSVTIVSRITDRVLDTVKECQSCPFDVFYEFNVKIRRMIYTTSIIENLNRVIRKYKKGKIVFLSYDAVPKAVFLTVGKISKKWSMSARQ